MADADRIHGDTLHPEDPSDISKTRKLLRWLLINLSQLYAMNIFSPKLDADDKKKSTYFKVLIITILLCYAHLSLFLALQYRYDHLKLKVDNYKPESVSLGADVELQLAQAKYDLKRFIGLLFANHPYVAQPIIIYAMWIAFVYCIEFNYCDRYIQKIRYTLMTAICFPEVDQEEYQTTLQIEVRKLMSSIQVSMKYPAGGMSFSKQTHRKAPDIYSDDFSLRIVQQEELTRNRQTESCIKFRRTIEDLCKDRQFRQMSNRSTQKMNLIAGRFLALWAGYTLLSNTIVVTIVVGTLIANDEPLYQMGAITLAPLIFIILLSTNVPGLIIAMITFSSLDQVELVNSLRRDIDRCIQSADVLPAMLALNKDEKTLASLKDQLNTNLISSYLKFMIFKTQLRPNLMAQSFHSLAILQIVIVTMIQAKTHAPNLGGKFWYIYLLGAMLLVFWSDLTLTPVCMLQSRCRVLIDKMSLLFAHMIKVDEAAKQSNIRPTLKPILDQHISWLIRRLVDQSDLLADIFATRIFGLQLHVSYSNLLKAHLYLGLVILSVLMADNSGSRLTLNFL